MDVREPGSSLWEMAEVAGATSRPHSKRSGSTTPAAASGRSAPGLAYPARLQEWFDKHGAARTEPSLGAGEERARCGCGTKVETAGWEGRGDGALRVRAREDAGAFIPLYRECGADALGPKPEGRPRGRARHADGHARTAPAPRGCPAAWGTDSSRAAAGTARSPRSRPRGSHPPLEPRAAVGQAEGPGPGGVNFLPFL